MQSKKNMRVNRNHHAYRDTLRRQYSELRELSRTRSSTADMLDQIEELLDYCLMFESPERESIFVEEVCRMNRDFHMAA